MTGSLSPYPLFNPVTADVDSLLSGWEIVAGPFGLLLFLLLIPFIRLAARRSREGALIGGGLVWIFATSGPWTTLVLPAWLAIATAWVMLLARGVRSGALSPRMMVALTWLGMAALLAPMWWRAQWPWYGWHGSRMALLHNVGFAYFLLRYVSWGVALSRNPNDTPRPGATAAWLLYAPCMRLGPVLLRDRFLKRFDAWNPRAPIDWRRAGRRTGWFLLGGIGIGVIGKNLPHIAPGAAGFFSDPAAYATADLLRVFYLVPIQVYLLLWTYNELAAVAGLLVGIEVDNNFDWLPRATSVRDFWRRWHTTVGVWLREYIYIPLGGNRGIVLLNYLAVFAFCALWHGPALSFLAWGLSQALALWVQRLWDQARKRLGRRDAPHSRAWTCACRLATMHYQIATVLIFTDFDHSGSRLLRELIGRISGE